MILASKRTFKRYGQSGIEVSDLFPATSQCVDDLAIIRSCYHEGFTHSQAQFLINNGLAADRRPSMGSWILYGLGENQNLPGFVVLLEGGVRSGPAVYGKGFLPAAYQGTSFRPGRNPILNLTPPKGMRRTASRICWRRCGSSTSSTWRRAITIRSCRRGMEAYELAFRMQMSRARSDRRQQRVRGDEEAVRPRRPRKPRDFGGRCLLARRLVERGVRFVQVWNGDGMNADDWDGHIACDKNHLAQAPRRRTRRVAGPADRPEGARPARHHAGHLGRRVRPQPGVGRRRGRVGGPRPQPLRLHDLDGRRRHQGREGDRGYRRTRPARRRRPRPPERSAREHPGAAGPGPHQAHVPVSRAAISGLPTSAEKQT